jgi:hypothetical protein
MTGVENVRAGPISGRGCGRWNLGQCCWSAFPGNLAKLADLRIREASNPQGPSEEKRPRRDRTRRGRLVERSRTKAQGSARNSPFGLRIVQCRHFPGHMRLKLCQAQKKARDQSPAMIAVCRLAEGRWCGFGRRASCDGRSRPPHGAPALLALSRIPNRQRFLRSVVLCIAKCSGG